MATVYESLARRVAIECFRTKRSLADTKVLVNNALERKIRDQKRSGRYNHTRDKAIQRETERAFEAAIQRYCELSCIPCEEY